MVSGGAPAIGCDLATGTTAPSRAQRRWPILDVHDVKQQNANSESLVEAAKLRFTMRAQNLETRDSSKHACAFVRAHRNAHAFRQCALACAVFRSRARRRARSDTIHFRI